MVPSVIYVYNTRGASFSAQLYESIKRVLPYISRDIIVKQINQADLTALGKLDPKTVAAFFLPGGHAPEYNKSLGRDGSRIIKEYVAQGGTFYGICAGAYYSAKSLSWMYDYADRAIKKDDLTLNFFDGHAHGPNRELISCAESFNHFAFTDVVPVVVKDRFSLDNPKATYLAHSFYMAGPYFQGDIDPDHIMAHYQMNGKHQPPCVLNIPHNNNNGGRSILISSHPEVSYQDLEFFCNNPNLTSEKEAAYITSLMEKLKENHAARERFWYQLLSYAIPEIALIPGGAENIKVELIS